MKNKFKQYSKKDQQGILILISLFIFAIVVFSVGKIFKSEKADKTTSCFKSTSKSSIFILDQTSELNEQTRDEIKKRIERIIEQKVDVGEQIIFFEVNGKAVKSLTPLEFSNGNTVFCKPKAHADSDLTENDELIQRKFKKKMDELFKNEFFTKKKSDDYSPITQVLFDSSLTDFAKRSSVSYYIFSDLMEHTEKTTIYGCSSGDMAIGQYKNSRIGRAERPSFKNVNNFEFHKIPISINLKELRCRDKFWNWFTGDMIFLKDNTHKLEAFDLPG